MMTAGVCWERKYGRRLGALGLNLYFRSLGGGSVVVGIVKEVCKTNLILYFQGWIESTFN